MCVSMSSFNLQNEADTVVISIFADEETEGGGVSDGSGIHTEASGFETMLNHSTNPPISQGHRDEMV